MPVSAANTNATADTTDRELIFTRVFDAPRETGLQSLDRSKAFDPVVGAKRLYHHRFTRWT